MKDGNFPGSGYSGSPHYKGGFLGSRALLESFNPWDIIKASARGFRWLFVGVGRRKEDSSYQRDDGVEPLGTELRDRVQPNDPIAEELARAPAGTNVYTVSGLRGAYAPDDEETAYRGPTYPVGSAPTSMPYMPDEYASQYPDSRNKAAPPWRRGDDDDAWGTAVGPEDESARPSFEYEGRAGLIKHAAAPGTVSRPA